MRQIGSIPRELDAERFSDYLLAHGIPNMVEETSNGDWAVWVESDDQLDQGRAELHAFLSNPEDSRYPAASRAAQAVRQQESRRQSRLRKKFIDVRTQLGAPAQWATPLSTVLIAISLIVAALTQLGSHHGAVLNALLIASVERTDGLIRWSGLDQILSGQVWRLVTPIFLHFGPLHLLFNMFWTWDLGRQIEARRTTWFLLVLVLTSAVISNLGQYFWTGPLFGGMSGVVYALFGYCWLKGRYEPQSGIGVTQQTVIIMVAWLVIAMTGMLGNIANTAHVIGLIIGLLFGGSATWWRYAKRRMR